MRHEEHELQKSCVKWFRLAYPKYAWMLFAVPNGGLRSASQAKSLKAEGVVAGVSDMILLVPRNGHGALCLEFKTKIGYQSPEQKVWQQETEKMGNEYVIVRSFDTFRESVKSYLGEDDGTSVQSARERLKDI